MCRTKTRDSCYAELLRKRDPTNNTAVEMDMTNGGEGLIPALTDRPGSPLGLPVFRLVR